MYEFLNMLSQWLYDPLTRISYGLEHIPLLFAFFLGLLGAISPCQLTGNIGAITYYGQRSIHREKVWGDVFFYLLGKMVIYTSLGLMVWWLGQEIEGSMTVYFVRFRQFLGPIFILVGLFLLRIIKIKWSGLFNNLLPIKRKNGYIGSFLLGASFALGFCPTMGVVFFALLMPIVISSPIGIALPSVFAIGTAFPFLLFMFLMWYFEISSTLLNKGRKIGLRIQQIAGIFLVLIGILDTITYWSF
ncbi:sulfite exporter TauE/SafE family protein [Virgibacillus byunsanensis]|uniref:Sulfite exporter TauE/SafE family protein n=1 Tax=Virgibacillus byunsanensis TaxID=570945 RepID=A0ABW3LFM3_9BACI